MSQVAKAASGAAASVSASGKAGTRRRDNGIDLTVFLKNDSTFKDTSNYGYQIEKTFSLANVSPILEDTRLWVAATEAGGEDGLTLKFRLTKSL